MFRGLIAIVTTAAVFWHTVAGCCAHHSHGGHFCDVVGKTASLAHHCGPEFSGGCCTHAHVDSKPSCASKSSGQQLGEDSPTTPCPGDGPTGCTEGTCVFAAPVSSGQSPIDQLVWDGSFLSYAVVDTAVLPCASRANELHESVAPPPLGGLRLHLAHCVLTL
jgi:hypothetical protein